MATQKIRIGNIKGPQGERGKTGEQGIPGAAASVKVGAVTTSDYGSNAKVTNSGTSSAAVLDFQIPQGAPGETVTDVSELVAKSITASDAQFPTFTVGEKMKAVLGKIQKYLTDLKADVGQRLLATNVANNLATTVAGYALDARQGKALADKNASLENRITQLNGKFEVSKVFNVMTVSNGFVKIENAPANAIMASVVGARKTRNFGYSISKDISEGWSIWSNVAQGVDVLFLIMN